MRRKLLVIGLALAALLWDSLRAAWAEPDVRDRVGRHQFQKLQLHQRRTLVSSVTLELSPGVMVATSGSERGVLLGFCSEVSLTSFGDLLVVRGEIESYHEGAFVRSDWSVGVTLGDGLTRPAKRVVETALGEIGSLARKLPL